MMYSLTCDVPSLMCDVPSLTRDVPSLTCDLPPQPCILTNLINGRKLSCLHASAFPKIGITDFEHIKVSRFITQWPNWQGMFVGEIPLMVTRRHGDQRGSDTGYSHQCMWVRVSCMLVFCFLFKDATKTLACTQCSLHGHTVLSAWAQCSLHGQTAYKIVISW